MSFGKITKATQGCLYIFSLNQYWGRKTRYVCCTKHNVLYWCRATWCSPVANVRSLASWAIFSISGNYDTNSLCWKLQGMIYDMTEVHISAYDILMPPPSPHSSACILNYWYTKLIINTSWLSVFVTIAIKLAGKKICRCQSLDYFSWLR